MKKCAIMYTDKKTGKQFWSDSVDERGCTYCLRPKVSDFPRGHYDATEFYGKNRIKEAQDRISRDKKDIRSMRFLSYNMDIVEYEREPEWYFEIWYVLEHAYKTKLFNPVPKGFPLNNEIEYEIHKGNDRPTVHDLPLEELKRFLEWRKAHYKGTVREI